MIAVRERAHHAEGGRVALHRLIDWFIQSYGVYVVERGRLGCLGPAPPSTISLFALLRSAKEETDRVAASAGIVRIVGDRPIDSRGCVRCVRHRTSSVF